MKSERIDTERQIQGYRNRNKKLGKNVIIQQTLDEIIKEYNETIKSQIDSEKVPTSNQPIRPNLINYAHIEKYANINKQTPPQEARKKLLRIKKATAIAEFQKQKKEYNQEEIHKIDEEIVSYFRSNKEQFNIAKKEHGRVQQADMLFWELPNDNMSIDAWAYFCEYGNQYPVQQDGDPNGSRNLLPGCEAYYNEQVEQRSKETQRKTFEPDENFVKSNVEPFFKIIDSEKVRELHDGFKKDYQTGGKEVVVHLSEIFGLKTPPEILFKPDDKEKLGLWRGSENKIEIFCQDSLSSDNPKAELNFTKFFGTIFHEMWHARQYNIAFNGAPSSNKNEDIAELYSNNFNNYIEAKEDFDEYKKQLIEAEASLFGNYYRKLFAPPENNLANNRERRRLSRERGHKIFMAYLLVTAIAIGASGVSAAIIAHKQERKNHSKENPNKPYAYTNKIDKDSNADILGPITIKDGDETKVFIYNTKTQEWIQINNVDDPLAKQHDTGDE